MKSFDNREPTFIIKGDSKKICKTNNTALAGCGDRNPIGKELSEVIHIEKNVGSNITPAFFDDKWFSLKQETFLWRESPSIKVRLERRTNIPTRKLMKSLKNMIGFLLHRIRSPLTGIQGYAELIETNSDIEESAQHIDKISKGADELFELLDELDTLQKIPLSRVELQKFSADPVNIINDIIGKYPVELSDNIIFEEHDHSTSLQCNPGDLRRILSFLIDNAIEFAPAKEHQITISQPSPNAIKVAHDGNPIPKKISQQLFYPFVTTKARKLGIGLTMAILYANRYDGSIFVANNKPFQETSFLLCLPPKNKYPPPSLL